MVEDPVEAERSKQREERAEQRESDNLKTQQRATDASERAATAGERQVSAVWAQTGLAAIGTVALIYTLFLTRRSVGLAQQAAQAAMDAVSAERAWVTPLGSSLIVYGNYSSDGAGERTWGIGLRWQNDGRSPAVNVNTSIDYRIVDAQNAIPKFQGTSSRPGGAIVGPGRDIVSVEFVLNDETVQKIMRGEAFLFVYGRVDYNDVFSLSQRHTECCCAIEITNEAQTNGMIAPTLLLHFVGPQNTVS